MEFPIMLSRFFEAAESGNFCRNVRETCFSERAACVKGSVPSHRKAPYLAIRDSSRVKLSQVHTHAVQVAHALTCVTGVPSRADLVGADLGRAT